MFLFLPGPTLRAKWRVALICLMCLAFLAAAPQARTAPAATATATTTAGADRGTLAAVRAAGQLACGVVVEQEDWTKGDLHEGLAPFGVEICKAVAVAALGDKAKVEVHPYNSSAEAAQGVARGEVALALGLTPSANTMWHWNLAFGPPVFFDGQGILLRGDAKATTLADLTGLHVCYIEGTENETVLQARGLGIVPLPFQEEGEMEDGLAGRHCDAISAYVSRLAVERASFPRQLGGDRILSEWLTIDPMAPAYRRGDAAWSMLVDWTIQALIQAEASGVTSANVSAMRSSADPVMRRLLGMDWVGARALGLDDHAWAAKVIAVVGNYGEIYERTVGASLHLPRGRNALWTKGGLLFPLPLQ